MYIYEPSKSRRGRNYCRCAIKQSNDRKKNDNCGYTAQVAHVSECV